MEGFRFWKIKDGHGDRFVDNTSGLELSIIPSSQQLLTGQRYSFHDYRGN